MSTVPYYDKDHPPRPACEVPDGPVSTAEQYAVLRYCAEVLCDDLRQWEQEKGPDSTS